jgi:competence ComEA-like helix-hairpin-helix protein
MKLPRLNERKYLILGILLGIFLSGLVALILSTNNIARQNLKRSIVYENIGYFIGSESISCFDVNNPLKEKVDINTATIGDLDSLPNIGEAKAKSIIEFRQKYGNFKTIEELIYVSGISETLFQQICGLISVSKP